MPVHGHDLHWVVPSVHVAVEAHRILLLPGVAVLRDEPSDGFVVPARPEVVQAGDGVEGLPREPEAGRTRGAPGQAVGLVVRGVGRAPGAVRRQPDAAEGVLLVVADRGAAPARYQQAVGVEVVNGNQEAHVGPVDHAGAAEHVQQEAVALPRRDHVPGAVVQVRRRGRAVLVDVGQPPLVVVAGNLPAAVITGRLCGPGRIRTCDFGALGVSPCKGLTGCS